MDDEATPGSPRSARFALAAAVAVGAALVGVGVGGLVGVDRQLEAATPQDAKTRVVSEGDGHRGDCPADADKPRPKQSRKL